MDLKTTILRYRFLIILLISTLVIGMVVGFLNFRNEVEIPERVASVNLENNLIPVGQFKYEKPNIKGVVMSNSFSFLNYPKDTNLPVFEYAQNDILAENNIEEFAKALGFTNLRKIDSPVQGKVFTASTSNPYRHLLVESDLGRISIDQTTDFDNALKFSTNEIEEQILETAKNYISQLPIDLSGFQYDSIEFLIKPPTSGEFVKTLQPKLANIASVKYISKINDYDLITKNSSLKPNELVISINPEKIVQTIYIEPVGKIGVKLYEIPIITPTEATEKIKTPGEINLIDPEGLNPTVNPDSLYINSANIAYIGADGLLLPVLIVNSRVLIENNKHPYVLPSELNLRGYINIIPKNEN